MNKDLVVEKGLKLLDGKYSRYPGYYRGICTTLNVLYNEGLLLYNENSQLKDVMKYNYEQRREYIWTVPGVATEEEQLARQLGFIELIYDYSEVEQLDIDNTETLGVDEVDTPNKHRTRLMSINLEDIDMVTLIMITMGATAFSFWLYYVLFFL